MQRPFERIKIKEQNKAMRSFDLSAAIFHFLLVFAVFASAKVVLANPAENEFNLKKEYLQERYQDFYIMLNEEDRGEIERQKGAGQMRAEREAWAKKYEQFRKEFVRTRKPAPEMDSRKHEAELAEQKVGHEKARKEYLAKQRQLKQIEKRVGVIPESYEYDLDPNYDPSADY